MSTNLRYPYHWGKSIVQGFVETHARGTYFLGKLIDLSPGEVRHDLTLALCRGCSWKFEAIKRAIKYLEEYQGKDLFRFSPADRELLYKWYVRIASEEYLDRSEDQIPLDTLRQRRLSY